MPAKTAAELAATDLANVDMGRRHLIETESAEYFAAREVLAASGATVIDAVREFAEPGAAYLR